MRKSKILLSMCLALILSLFQNSFAQSNDLVLSIDGKQINFSHENKPKRLIFIMVIEYLTFTWFL
ncbi:hypothetical protein [Gottschalkia acidurici]|uniref:hypothetical protein n=1 Tax=Clostridium acidurici TaxID=1556 RepID=UPI00059F925C|nr:hypothetical protein [Gottschalkia acidurici]